MQACYPSLLSVTVISAMTKTNLWNKEITWLTHTYYSLSLRQVKAGTQGRNPEAENEAEAMEECWLLI